MPRPLAPRTPARAHRPGSAHRSSCPTTVVFLLLQMRIWRISAHRSCGAGCHRPWRPEQTGGHLREGRPVRRDAPAIGKQRTSVLEHYDAVAEQAPSLFGMRRHHVGRLAIWCVRGRAGRLMLAHNATSIILPALKLDTFGADRRLGAAGAVPARSGRTQLIRGRNLVGGEPSPGCLFTSCWRRRQRWSYLLSVMDERAVSPPGPVLNPAAHPPASAGERNRDLPYR
jgi:hypothetical protein